MELVQTVVNALVVAAVGVILGAMVHGLRGEMGSLRAEFNGLRGELKAHINEFRQEVRTEIGDVRREIADLRSDLTQVALAVGTRPRAERNR